MEKKFAQGLCFKKIFIYFVLGSLLGVFYEEILHVIKHGYWESRRGLIYGPFNPAYGIGLALAIGLFGKDADKKKWYILFIECAILEGATEYIINFLQESLLNTRSWNYSNHFLNINGRTTVPFMIFWGALGLLLIKFVYLKTTYLIEKIPYNIGNILFYILLVFMIINMLLSLIAAYRYTERRKNIKPKTIIGEICDKIYTDEYLDGIYSNAVYSNS